MKSIFLVIFIGFLSLNTNAQVNEMAIFKAVGKDFEQFHFGSMDGKNYIFYTYGTVQRHVDLNFRLSEFKGEKAIRITFKNNYSLYILIRGEDLKVLDAKGKYLKVFYPIKDDRTDDERLQGRMTIIYENLEAVKFLKSNFFKTK